MFIEKLLQLMAEKKASDIFMTVAAYQQLSEAIDCPLHVGVTEAGGLRSGTIKSAIGMGSLLWAGIYFMNATVTLLLLMNLPVTTFVATKTVACLAITWCGIFLTFTSSMRVLRAVGMVGKTPAAEPATAIATAAPAAAASAPAAA